MLRRFTLFQVLLCCKLFHVVALLHTISGVAVLGTMSGGWCVDRGGRRIPEGLTAAVGCTPFQVIAVLLEGFGHGHGIEAGYLWRAVSDERPCIFSKLVPPSFFQSVSFFRVLVMRSLGGMS